MPIKMFAALREGPPLLFTLRERYFDFRHRLRLEKLVDPEGRFLYYWLGMVAVSLLYNFIGILARTSFTGLEAEGWQLAMWFCFDYFCDGIYVTDIIVQLNTAFIFNGLLVKDKKAIRQKYLKTRGFIVDVVSVIPIDLIIIIVRRSEPISRLNRLLRFDRLNQFFDKTETRTNYPHVFRIINLVLYIFMCIHFFACCYFLLSKHVGFGADKWVYPNTSLPQYASVRTQYAYSLYWATLTLTTIGEIATPVRDIELIFVTVSFLLGVLIFATIVGSVGNIITNLNIGRSEFLKRVDSVKKYFKTRSVDKEIQHRVFRWFSYIWDNKLSFEEDSALAVIPTKLRAEVLMNVHLNTLKRVSIFKDCEAGLLGELVLKLKLMVFSPGDFICRKGDVGREMYIIKNGRVEVICDEGKTVYATLTDGSVFGEVSLLNIAGSKFGNRRTANVRSIGYSDIFVLSKEDLWDTLKDYPDAKARLMEHGRHILIQQNLVNDNYVFPTIEKDDIGEEVWNILVELSAMRTRLKDLVLELQYDRQIDSQTPNHNIITPQTNSTFKNQNGKSANHVIINCLNTTST